MTNISILTIGKMPKLCKNVQNRFIGKVLKFHVNSVYSKIVIKKNREGGGGRIAPPPPIAIRVK